MKIKAVCDKTGLTDRAVRFYIDEELLTPCCHENYLGRKSYEFSEEDVKTLSDIATARRFGFSVSQIRQIIHHPDKSAEIIEVVRLKKQDAADAEQIALSALGKVSDGNARDISGLAAALEEAARLYALPKEDESAHTKDPSYILMFLEILAYCAGIGVGIIALMVAADMVIHYMESGLFMLNIQGMTALWKRVGRYVVPTMIIAALAVRMGYYVWILWKYGRNYKEPELTIRGMVVDKKTRADSVAISSFYHRDGGMIWVLCFRTNEGKTLELTVSGERYHQTNIGTRGQLRYQGTKLLDFAPDSNITKLGCCK